MANTPLKDTFAHLFLKDLQAELQQRDFDTIFQRSVNRLVIKKSVLRLVQVDQKGDLVTVALKVITDPRERTTSYRTTSTNYQIVTKEVEISNPEFDPEELKQKILTVMDKINAAIAEFGD